jgi:hypothetical protein
MPTYHQLQSYPYIWQAASMGVFICSNVPEPLVLRVYLPRYLNFQLNCLIQHLVFRD